MWPDSVEDAAALAAQLNALGLSYWRPTTGDLHACDAWPVRSDTPSPDWARYLDIQIPYAEGNARDDFLGRLGQAVEEGLSHG
ncbi:hypothetical protein AB0M44_46585 [Streptosporangium subroseum]|uniref:hypothetical protein n=1 Tax=Streptosporangium subroseum TaxID=106412 RepID=UPI00342C5A61